MSKQSTIRRKPKFKPASQIGRTALGARPVQPVDAAGDAAGDAVGDAASGVGAPLSKTSEPDTGR